VVVVGANGALSVAGAKPADLYQALQAQRKVLREQLSQLEDQRQELVSTLEEQPQMGAVARKGVEQRLTSVDDRIQEVNQQIAGSEREIARVAGIPGAAVEPPRPPEPDEGPEEAVAIIGTTFTLLVLFPLALAHARRIWRRSAKVVAALPGEMAERFTRLEQTVDSVAIEVERISEGQRFVTKLLAEGRTGLEARQAAALGGAAAAGAQRAPVRASPNE
jgi:cell division septum initiation protein DivIVA